MHTDGSTKGLRHTPSAFSTAPTEQLPAIREKPTGTKDKAVQIPRVFWFACAYGIVVITTGVAYMAVHATTSSIEAFGTKLELTRALAREKDVLDTVEKLATAPAPLPWSIPAPVPTPAMVPKPADLPARIKGWREANVQQQQQQGQ